MRYLIPIIGLGFAACSVCKVTPSKYMCVAPQPALLPSDSGGYGVQEKAECMAPDAADKQLEILADILVEDRHVRSRDAFLAEIKSFPPTLEWMANPDTFYCGSGRKVAGCTHVDWMQVLVSDCVGHTALAHELVHVYLMRTSRPDGDATHSDPIWTSESNWLVRSHNELCK